jgi:hypothetical protein
MNDHHKGELTILKPIANMHVQSCQSVKLLLALTSGVIPGFSSP